MVTSLSTPDFAAPALINAPNANFVAAPADGVLPDDFFSTTNLPTYVKIEGMDHGLELAGSQKASFEGAEPHPFAEQVVKEMLRFFDSLRG